MDSIEVVPYDPAYRSEFERLNRSWLEGHDLLEPVDLEYLQHPERHILSTGGEVFFAVQNGNVYGTCAAIRMSPATFELAKLAVEPSVRSQGLGRRLCRVVLDHARRAGATEVVLTSHSVLSEAIKLYESLGFRHAPMPPDVRYATANVFMRLTLR